MTKKDAERLWNEFMINVHVDSNVDCVNFLGSVEKHKRLFDKAVERMLDAAP